tara:strand:+ start:7109 stop:7714 length:606 start_codon:yes stop_codon:yes gene_type:complete
MNLGAMWSNNLKSKNNRNLKRKSKNLLFKNINNTKIIKSNNNNNRVTNNVPRKDSRAYWGTPTWILFHTIAEKIDNNFYINNYMVIWDFIGDVCKTLPCPFCKTHAVNYIKGVNLNSIKSKEGLKRVLFDFHNNANQNSNKKIEDISILNKYKNANVLSVFNHFERRFFVSYIGTRQFNDWIKNALKEKFKEFCRVINDYI